MKNSLASDILRAEKKKATFWKIATIAVIIVAIAEFLIIINKRKKEIIYYDKKGTRGIDNDIRNYRRLYEFD